MTGARFEACGGPCIPLFVDRAGVPVSVAVYSFIRSDDLYVVRCDLPAWSRPEGVTWAPDGAPVRSAFTVVAYVAPAGNRLGSVTGSTPGTLILRRAVVLA